MTDEFERRHGFPPGANQVRPADHDDQAAAKALDEVGLAPADLVTFYGRIGDLAWEDIGNGYFIDPVPDVLRRLEAHGAVDLGAVPEAGRGLVIGSNGGGLSYVTGPSGVVYRTRTASLDEPELDRVADDLRQFLERLEESLARFIANGEPGNL
ncbi:SMI1/KNR4 family protein [Streptomyces spongiae]|uniref:SMI1/KNR4 family protein n=1 Tax=Streptomyces spongiae TaxID=565072 RepID=A0A5N8XJA8_9ACTN|nr:SMI1/KNR4 family protein [Streptomyces spongiae]